MAKQCVFWDCNQNIQQTHTYCYDHYGEYADGYVDNCPSCGRGKYAEYDACLDCYKKGDRPPTKQTSYDLEYSPAWEAGDSEAFEFYVYILKLSDNSFYVGQTRDLRPRLSEHRDSKVRGTAGKSPELAWFTVVPTRRDATELEAELKEIRDNNERLLRQIIIGFEDMVREMAIFKER